MRVQAALGDACLVPAPGERHLPQEQWWAQLGWFVCHQGHPRGWQPALCSCGSWPWPSPVPFAVVQGAAGSEGFVVVLSPPQQGHHGPEGSKQPCKHHHGGSCAPLQPAPCGKRKRGLHAPNKTTGNSWQALGPQAQQEVVHILYPEADPSLEESVFH